MYIFYFTSKVTCMNRILQQLRVINFVNVSVTELVGGDNPEWGVALGMSFVKS